MSDKKLADRRSFLAKSSALAALATAGCLGGTDDPGDSTEADTPSGDETENDGGDNTSDLNWPPRRIEIGVYSSPGSTLHTFATYLADALGRHIKGGDEADVIVQSLSGTGGGMTVTNYVANTSPDGSIIGDNGSGQMAIGKITSPDVARYDPATLNYVGRSRQVIRGFHVNPKTMGVDGYSQWDWGDFVDNAMDMKIASVGPTHPMTGIPRVLYRDHPDLDESYLDDNVIHYSGGGEVRAAMERGEVDCSFNSFRTSLKRGPEGFYWTQFAVTASQDERFLDDLNSLYDEEVVTLNSATDHGFSQEAVDFVDFLSTDHTLYFLPPNVPDEVYDIWADGLDGAFNDSDLVEKTEELWGGAYQPISGQNALELGRGLWDIAQQNEADITDLFASE